jgi:hypothetical protein
MTGCSARQHSRMNKERNWKKRRRFIEFAIRSSFNAELECPTVYRTLTG